MNIPTPHIKAKKGDFAKTVLMPGDPLRAKYIAEKFLDNAILVTDVRGVYGYTGLYKGVKVSVMASGMGHPSIGIYSHELYTEFDVDTIIRVGTCGSYQPYINLKDILVCMTSSTDSNWTAQHDLHGTYSAFADFQLLKAAEQALIDLDLPHHVGGIFSADVFYDWDNTTWKKWAKMNIMGVEMESYALYTNAAIYRKRALTMLTVTDNFNNNEHLTADERQNGLGFMIRAAIRTAEKFAKEKR